MTRNTLEVFLGKWTMSATTYGKRLQATLKVLRYTQASLADAVGVSQTSVSKWMRGVTNPELPQLVKTCRFLRISSDFLVLCTDDVTEESIHTRRLIDDAIKMLGLVESYKRLMMMSNGGGGSGGGVAPVEVSGSNTVGRILSIDDAADRLGGETRRRADRHERKSKSDR